MSHYDGEHHGKLNLTLSTWCFRPAFGFDCTTQTDIVLATNPDKFLEVFLSFVFFSLNY